MISSYGNDFNTYLKVISGVSLNNKDYYLDGSPVTNEAANRAGNHLGTIDIGFSFELNKHRLFVYRQSIYEDGSLYYLNNISDGLLGISLASKKSKYTNFSLVKINFEYLNTISQGGNTFSQGYFIPELRGLDNYFNNITYTDGWTYRNQTIGTPFISPLSQYENLTENQQHSNPNAPINNRLKTLYISTMFHIHDCVLTARYSFTNYETGYFTSSAFLTQHSYLLNGKAPLSNGYYLNLSFSGDVGKFLPNSTGLSVAVKKTF